jgi:hypothetical protein
MNKATLSLLTFLLLMPIADAQQSPDYRSRTIYFIVTDRFYLHQPYAPYVDPEFPEATNTVNCFETACTRHSA